MELGNSHTRTELQFFFTFPSSGILETRKHDVSETGSVSVLRRKGGEDTQLGPLERAPFHLRTETDPVSETSCFLVSRIPDNGKVQKKTVILCVIHHRQNPSESTHTRSFTQLYKRI
jgi:hypothetical protein